MKRLLILWLLSCSCLAAFAQEKPHQFTLEGYIDVYYALFTDSVGPNALQRYATVSPRSHRFGLNTAQVSGAYMGGRLRGNLILHYGDIAEATWAEPFRAVQAANVGLHLGKGWWIDAGFFATHIGTESFLPKNNWLSSTTVATYNEPFYQSGVRVAYEGAEKWSAQVWVVSGYNFFLDVNDAKSAGLYLTYKPSESLSLTYTNLFGQESLDDVKPAQFRTYHNLYLNWQAAGALSVMLGGDLGTQSHSALDNPDDAALMYNALLAVRYRPAERWAITARGEIFSDPDGFISGALEDVDGQPAGLELIGWTLGLEYRPTPELFLRAESRWLQTPEDLQIFYWSSEFSRQRWEWMITAGVALAKTWN